MGMTLVEKILANRSGRDQVKPGENIWVDVDVLMVNDVTGPPSVAVLKKNFGENAKVWDPEKFVLIHDHYVFTEDPHANRNLEDTRKFAAEQKLPYFYEAFADSYRGVCHTMLAQEGHCRPGEVLFGADSHTCTAGAFGQFASGIGSTDAAYILGTGKLWVKVPETMRFTIDGILPEYVTGKDIILRIISDIGTDGATYRCMQFDGNAIRSLNMEDRMTITNMAVEAGAKCGIIEADEITCQYLQTRTRKPYNIMSSDPDAGYHSITHYKAHKLEPFVAMPHSPGNGEKARNLSHIKIDRSYIGSCTGGKTSDFLMAARLLKGRQTAVETFIIPATREVEEDLRQIRLDGESCLEIFEKAGCLIGQPSCAACLGGPDDTFGRAQGNEVIISTTNRNFPGRMGTMESQVYLASAYTAAASAITGHITDPRDL